MIIKSKEEQSLDDLVYILVHEEYRDIAKIIIDLKQRIEALERIHSDQDHYDDWKDLCYK